MGTTAAEGQSGRTGRTYSTMSASLDIQKLRPARVMANSRLSSVRGGRRKNMMATSHSSKAYPGGVSGNGGGGVTEGPCSTEQARREKQRCQEAKRESNQQRQRGRPGLTARAGARPIPGDRRQVISASMSSLSGPSLQGIGQKAKRASSQRCKMLVSGCTGNRDQHDVEQSAER